MKRLFFIFSILCISYLFPCNNFDPEVLISGSEPTAIPTAAPLYFYPDICANDAGQRNAIWERQIVDTTVFTPPQQTLLQHTYYDPITMT